MKDFKNNPLKKKSYDFALKIVLVTKKLMGEKREFILSKQLLRSGTSIGANIAEANGAISNTDFSAKISIAYKESLETKYGLSLLKDSEYIQLENFESLHKDCDEISRILYSILKKTRLSN